MIDFQLRLTRQREAFRAAVEMGKEVFIIILGLVRPQLAQQTAMTFKKYQRTLYNIPTLQTQEFATLGTCF